MKTDLSGIVPGIIDTHLHQWDPFSTPREASLAARINRFSPKIWQRLAPLALDKATQEFLISPEHVVKPYLPSDFKKDSDETMATVGVPVEGGIHIEAVWQSNDPTEETYWLKTLPFDQLGAPKLLGIVGHADPTSADFAKVLDAHKQASNRFRGIRFLTAWHPDKKIKNWASHEGMMTSAKFLNGFDALAKRNLTFDAYVYSAQLTEVVTLAQHYPETTIVLDHYASPAGILGPMGKITGRTKAERAKIFSQWQDDIAALAQCPNVISKQSILPSVLGVKEQGIGREALAELVAPMVQHTADVFGGERMMFGSNFPVDKPITSYGTSVGVLADILAPYGEEMLRNVFRETALKVYSIV